MSVMLSQSAVTAVTKRRGQIRSAYLIYPLLTVTDVPLLLISSPARSAGTGVSEYRQP